MKIHSPIGGFHSLTKLCGGLHILRILLLVPLTVLLHLRRAAAAAVLALMLLIDLAANLLARRFDLADDAAAVLESIADLLIQATLLCALVPRFPELGIAILALLARLALALVPDWIALMRNRSARLCGGMEKALCWLGCALMLVPLVHPGLSAGGARTLAIALSALNIAAIPLRAGCIRRS
ncbi:MAG: hypothetical protein Q4G06_07960 [Clostridia bacterium]|nr:hypothetical protein [Clostridia bacterium]